MSCPTGRQRGCAAEQGGFSLIAAIFLIVVLAALGAFAVQVAMSQYQSATSELLQARAQAAAEAGIDYDANLALRGAPSTSCLATNTLNLTTGALTGFVVKLACSSTTHQIYSPATATWKSYTVYALAATASKGGYGSQDYAARTVTRNVTNAPP